MPHPPSDAPPLRVTSVIVCGAGPIAAAIVRALRAADYGVLPVTEAAAVAPTLEAAQHTGTRVDALVNAQHADSASGTALETSERVWDAAVERELNAAFRACKAVLPHFVGQGGGAIVNVTGSAAYGRARHVAESAAHGGVIALGAALTYDHFNDRVRVNTIVCGAGATPADIAPLVLFLLSPDAEVMSGSILDAGLAAYQGGY